MKKLMFVPVFIALLSWSCTNKPMDKPVVAAAISATVDGAKENFTIVDSAGYSNTPAKYSLSISAVAKDQPGADQIELVVNSASPIAVGTYSLSASNHTAPFYPLIIYKVNGSSDFKDDYVVDYTGNHPVSIVITSLSSTNIQGTFSGTLIVAAGSSGATKTITNGVFNVDVK